MDVGTVTETGFDIADVNENDQLLIKTDEAGVVKTRWIFKNPEGKIIIPEIVIPSASRQNPEGDIIVAENIVSGSSVLKNADPKRQIMRLQTAGRYEAA